MMFFTLILLFISFQSTDGVSNFRDQSDEIDVVQSESAIKGASISGFSQATSRAHQTHVFRESTASGLSNRDDIVKMGRVPPDELHEVIFHIQGRNHDELTRVVHDISDPESPNYGKFLSRKELSEMTSNSDSHEFITNYLESAGATVLSETVSGDYITAAAPIQLWEEMLDTEFFSYYQIENQHKITNRVVRAEHYSMPKILNEHIAAAFNTIQMPFSIWAQPILEAVTDDVVSSIRAHVASGFIDPAVLKAYYNIESDVGSARATQAVYETIGQYYSPADLQQFQELFFLQPRAVDIDVGGHVSDMVCKSSPRKCIESNLDIQYIMAMSQGSPTYSLYTNLNSFASWLVTVCNMPNIPLVISISYGANEAEVTQSEFDAFNVQAMKLSAMGVTIVVSSGDDGASSFLSRYNSKNCGYMAMFPASSPYVLSIGATQGPEYGADEITCQSNLGGVITSGGGFSQYYPKPSWQSKSTSGYLKNVVGSKYLIIIGGNKYLVSGTSAAAPAVAGMISLVNAARLNAGRSPLGWINPILYANHQMFTNDVTSGKNNCSAGPICCKHGFQSTLGWDPATGFGSINFLAFKDFFMGIAVVPPKVASSRPTTRPVAATLRPTAIAINTLRPTAIAINTLRPTAIAINTLRPTAIAINTLRPTAVAVKTTTPTRQPTVMPTPQPTKMPSRQPTQLLMQSPKLSLPTLIPTTAPQPRNPFGSSRPPPSTQIASTFAPSYGIQKSKAKEPKRGPEPQLPGIFIPKQGGFYGQGPKKDDRGGDDDGKGKGKGKGKSGGKGKGKGK